MSLSVSKDLVALVADKNMEFSLRGLLSRPTALGIRPVTADVFVHPERDPGCFLQGHDFLRSFQNAYNNALVMFDRQGCGREDQDRAELENDLEERLAASGWEKRAVAIAIDPELENWVWTDSPHVAEALGWDDRSHGLRSWLTQKGFITEGAAKPLRPKEAVEEALCAARKPRSSALYRELAISVTFHRCTDPAFQKLREVLILWFGAANARSGPTP